MRSNKMREVRLLKRQEGVKKLITNMGERLEKTGRQG